MKYKFRDHYSHCFELKLTEQPITATDRLSPFMLFVSFLFGSVFFVLGAYLINITKITEQTDFEKIISKSAIYTHHFISPEIFGAGIIGLGLGITLVCLFYMCRYKNITIKDNNVTVNDHPFIGRPHSFSAPLNEYKGVRLRLEFCQYGLFNQNKFIIELYHTDEKKLVPLYISTNQKDIRTIWKKYALHFNLPPIQISDKGMISYAMRDLERSYAEVVKDWHLPTNFLVEKTHSRDFVCKKKNDKKILKTRHVIYDLYSTINIAVIGCFGFLLAYALCNHDVLMRVLSVGSVLAFYVFLLTCILYAYFTLIVRDIVLISDKKLIIFKKILGFTFPQGSVGFEQLKGLDIFFTPTTGRYCLNIITEQKIIKIFSKLSPDDLRWIKCFVVSEICQE